LDKSLREQIEAFLRDVVLRKAPEERTKRDEQLLEYGRAFADVLYRHEMADTSEPAQHEQTVTRLLKTANAINREYDLRDLDAEALSTFRKGK
jgi:hypothetical protein